METANQNFIGTTGNTSVTEVTVNGKTKFVLTNNKIFNRFNFVQEYLDEDTAWDRAETISRFERDFTEAHYCSITEEGEIELWFTDKEPHFYFIRLGELCSYSITGLRVSKPSKSFKLSAEITECVNYINNKSSLLYTKK